MINSNTAFQISEQHGSTFKVSKGSYVVEISQWNDGRWFGSYDPGKGSSKVGSAGVRDREAIIQWAKRVINQAILERSK
jgi:hypothetical protein